MSELYNAIVLIVVVPMMLGLVEVPGPVRRAARRALPEPDRAQDRPAPERAARAAEVSRLRHQFASRLL